MLISIIVPVYNASSTISKCVTSILNQTYREFQLILVDDGSTDESPAIIEKLCGSDNRVTIIHKKNGGVSSARNAGLKEARGGYTTFVDSDDWICKDFLLQMIEQIGRDDDLLFSGIDFLCGGRSCNLVKLPNRSWNLDDVSTKLEFIQLELVTSPVAKLYKTKVLKESNIKFNELMSYAEDRDFNIEFFNKIRKIKTTSYTGYNYIVDVNGSLSKQLYTYKMQNDFIYWEKLCGFLEVSKTTSKDVHQYLVNRLFNFLVDNCADIGNTFSFSEGRKLTYQAISILNKSYLNKFVDLISAPWWQKKMLGLSPKLLGTVELLIS